MRGVKVNINPRVKAKGYVIGPDGKVKVDTPQGIVKRDLKEMLMEER